ncbi:hypothetical protein EDC01DRAFT_670325 [Geopyxis carbonaria]|nr:hypothetical protein EDC01DRAFT_670325 [Geopyxis carbonaria]
MLEEVSDLAGAPASGSQQDTILGVEELHRQSVVDADKTTQTDDDISPNSSAGVTSPYKSHSDRVNMGSRNGQDQNPDSALLERPRDKQRDISAAHYLKRAEPQDLPAYPVSGLPNADAAGAAAASLAHSSAKPVEIWRPSSTSAAGAAASIAYVHQRPTDSIIVRKASAPTGFSAALAAVEQPNSPFQRTKQYELSEHAKQWSLTGALGAIEAQGRHRSESAPMPLENPKGVTTHLSKTRTLQGNHLTMGGAVENTPHVSDISMQEKQKSDVLKAATLSMAKNNVSSRGQQSERTVHPHIEEAARKAAEERLISAGYDPNRPPRMNKAYRGRARSMTSYTSEMREEKIDAEMQKLQDDIARADQRKKGQDALLLMTVARRNVKNSMSQQDRQIRERQGIIRREDWEPVANRIAQKKSDKRLENHGRISIGGGAYMSQGEIDAIAARNVRPVLDEINQKAYEHHEVKLDASARELEERLDRENEQRVAAFRESQERQTEAEIKRSKVGKRNQEFDRRSRRDEHTSSNTTGGERVESQPMPTLTNGNDIQDEEPLNHEQIQDNNETNNRGTFNALGMVTRRGHPKNVKAVTDNEQTTTATSGRVEGPGTSSGSPGGPLSLSALGTVIGGRTPMSATEPATPPKSSSFLSKIRRNISTRRTPTSKVVAPTARLPTPPSTPPELSSPITMSAFNQDSTVTTPQTAHTNIASRHEVSPIPTQSTDNSAIAGGRGSVLASKGKGVMKMFRRNDQEHTNAEVHGERLEGLGQRDDVEQERMRRVDTNNAESIGSRFRENL